MAANGYAVVTRYDLAGNEVFAFGAIGPSSECLTHAAIYATHADVMSVLHCHIPIIWQYTQQLGLDTTPDDVEYGSTAMAIAVQNLVKSSKGIFSMLGHADGIVAYGGSPEEALAILMSTFTAAKNLAAKTLT